MKNIRTRLVILKCTKKKEEITELQKFAENLPKNSQILKLFCFSHTFYLKQVEKLTFKIHICIILNRKILFSMMLFF